MDASGESCEARAEKMDASRLTMLDTKLSATLGPAKARPRAAKKQEAFILNMCRMQ